MASRPGSRRRRLLWRTLLPGVMVVIVAVLALVISRAGSRQQYRPGESVEGITRGLAREVPAGFAPVRFVDVAVAAGLDFRHFPGVRSTQLPEDMGSGVAWGDYDGDGDPDLYAVNQAGPLTEREAWASSPGSNRLYRNEGDGSFTDVTAEAGVGVRALGMAAVWGDVDSDGDLDLLVTNYGSLVLFENRGDGTFADITVASGLEQQGYWSGASFGDYDRDGDLDLYVCGYVQYTFDPGDRDSKSSMYANVVPASLNPSTYRPHRNLLFANDGDGRFVDVTSHAGVANLEGRSLSASWCDFDEDGWQDLYVANDISDNVMYRNRGDGTFEDVSHASWVADYRGAMGIAIADCDGDRDLDMFITHWIAQENALYLNLRSERPGLDGRAKPAFVNFVDDADRLGVGQIALDFVGWGTFFLDFDNDAHPDLFVANGSTFQAPEDPRRLLPMRPHLFWNQGTGRGFFEVGEFCGDYFKGEWVGRGAAPADYDGDGDVDIAVLNHGGQLALLQNQSSNRKHWLGIRLVGRGKNRFGVGAKVTVECGGKIQAGAVGATPSYMSQPDLNLHFGLGEAKSVDCVEVRWPGGKLQVLNSVTADQVLAIEEPR